MVCIIIALITLAASSVLDHPKLCPEKVRAHGREWDSPYFHQDCVVRTEDNQTRGATHEIHLVVFVPFSGAVGNQGSNSEPVLTVAAQEIEDSTLLPGYRVKFHVVDTEYTIAGATASAIRALSQGPRKHGVIASFGSDTCAAINDASQYFNILQIAPNCISPALSERARYPNFVRLVPSFRYYMLAAFAFVKEFGWHRVGIIHDWRALNGLAKDMFADLIKQDVVDAVWEWTILMIDKVAAASEVGPVVDAVKTRDSRVTLLAAYEDVGTAVFCAMAKRDMSSDYLVIVPAMWWTRSFMTTFAPQTECSAAAVFEAAFGTLGVDRGTMRATPDIHGLSGRMLQDITNDYMRRCSALFEGLGGCEPDSQSYLYDSLWHFAKILHQYLIDEGGDFDMLASQGARQRLFELSLRLDYMGLTGRVRQFNDVHPTTDVAGGSFGDRVGSMQLKQIRSMSDPVYVEVAQWSDDGTFWKESLFWSLDDASKVVSCHGRTGCDMENAWIPPDRNTSSCPTGTVWNLELGCDPCEAGKFAPPGASQCTACDVGKFGDELGLSACKDCLKGTATKDLSALSCEDCEVGSYSDVEGASACSWCERGTYSAEDGASACNACDGDLTTENIASRSPTDCTCNEGWYMSMEGVCERCSQGLVCAVGSSEEDWGKEGAVYPVVVAGYYTEPSSPLSVYLCKDEKTCPGGLPGSCPRNREGLACGSCEPGYFGDEGLCLKCPSFTTVRALFPVIAVVVAPVVLFGVILWKMPHDTDHWHRPSVALMMIIAVEVTFLQLLSAQGSLQLHLPGIWGQPIAKSSIAIDPVNLFKPECNDFRGFSSGYAARMCLPIFCLAIAGIAMVYGWIAKVTYLPRLNVIKVWSSIASFCGSMFLAFYLAIALQALSFFMCYPHPNGKSSLRSRPEVLCHEPEWASMMGVTLASILVYCVSTVAAIIFLVRVSAKHYHSEGFRISTAFIFRRFRVNCGYWTIVLIAKNLWISLSTVVFTQVDGQIMWFIMGVLAYVIACLAVAPYRHHIVSLVDIGAHAMIAYIFCGTIFFAETTKESQDRMGLVLLVLAGAGFSAFLLVLACQIFLVKNGGDAVRHDDRFAAAACRACTEVGRQPKNLEELLQHLDMVERGVFKKLVSLHARETQPTSIKAAGHVCILEAPVAQAPVEEDGVVFV
jgi:hypothetical protein